MIRVEIDGWVAVMLPARTAAALVDELAARTIERQEHAAPRKLDEATRRRLDYARLLIAEALEGPGALVSS